MALALAYAAPVGAQSVDPDAMMAHMQASQAQAAADAARPGDGDMECDALLAEMSAVMNDPAVQQQMAGMGAWAEGRQGQADQARADMRAMMMGSFVTGIISSFVPGAGYAQSLAQQGMMNRQAVQADQNQAEMMGMAQGMETIMPQLMRGQRLHELAEARQCAFLNEPPEGAPQE
jgi:hypothetical protein